jgi:SAM-dependent methyltransferase/chaperonin cofactor prefoldin
VIETTVPEINITELMERVRAEALRPKPAPHRSTPPDEAASALPPVAMLPGAPAVWIPGPVKSRKERVDELVETARQKNEPSSRIPKFLRRFFRKQGGYNRAVLESIAALSKTTDDLTRRLGEITTCLGQFNSWLLALHEQSDADANWMKAAAPAVAKVPAQQGELKQLHAEREKLAGSIKTLNQQQEELAGKINHGETRFRDQFAALSQQVEGAAALAEELRGEVDRLTVETREGRALRELQAQTDRLGTHVNNLQAFVDKHAAEIDATQTGLGQRLNEQANDAAFIKGELSEFGSLLRDLLGGERAASGALREKAGALKESETKPIQSLDSFYLSFENRFRGPREEIKKRVAFYLPFLRGTRAGQKGRPILDLGCGRGEWLELLNEQKLEAHGVDLSLAMVSHCKERHLKVRRAEAVAYLRSLKANSQGAVTGFHIIEHLPFEVLMELFGQARRVLKPGGIAIFESPNCKNLVVGACNFYIDPTHRNPVFPETAEFMLASHGFEKIRIEYLSPVPNGDFVAETPELATIKDLLYGPQDFGIIGYKPKAR